MTHDELLAKINDSTDGLKHDDIFPLLIANTQALRAVVELHKPMLWKNLGNDTRGYFCQHCDSLSNEDAYRINYPCPTIQSIEKELQ
jgi:hypothetical protein